MDSEFYYAVTITIIICIFTALSLALFVTYKLLSKYNDFGDSSCGLNDYSRFGITYNRTRDNVLPQEKYDFFVCYGDDPYEGIEHSIPEQLLKNSKKEEQQKTEEF